MEIFLMGFQFIAVVLALFTLPGSGYLLFITLVGWRRLPLSTGDNFAGRLAILMPAHNEAAVIERSLHNVLEHCQHDGHCQVFVIADNCSDDTAQLAQQAGARVLERQQPTLRGKGYALDFALKHLAEQGFAAYIIIDADTVVADNFLPCIRQQLADGSLALQTHYGVLNPTESVHTGLAQLAGAAFNLLRPRARQRLGLSAGLLGNGLVLSHQLVQRFPYQARSIVEDLEYHLQLQLAGVKVKFVDQTSVLAEMPTSQQGRTSQHSRWQGGRLAMLRQYGWPLFKRVVRGELHLLDALAELLLLPLSYQLCLLLLAALLGQGWVMWLALVGMGIMVLHVVAASQVAAIPAARLWQMLTHMPNYLLWKIQLIGGTLRHSDQQSPWVRTQRNG